MPLTKKGKKIKRAMEGFYGKKRGDRVFYASENAGHIKGVVRGHARFAMTDVELESGLRFLPRGHARRVERQVSPEELANETEFYRRSQGPSVRTQRIGDGVRSFEVILKHDQLGEIGSKTEVLRRGKVVSVHYVLPSLESLKAKKWWPEADPLFSGKGHSMRPRHALKRYVKTGKVPQGYELTMQGLRRRHSIRRRGHATSAKLKVILRSPTGLTVWALPNSDLQVLWPGPGARLRLGWKLMKPEGTATMIDHSTANGAYNTRKEAEEAVKRFIAAGRG